MADQLQILMQSSVLQMHKRELNNYLCNVEGFLLVTSQFTDILQTKSMQYTEYPKFTYASKPWFLPDRWSLPDDFSLVEEL